MKLRELPERCVVTINAAPRGDAHVHGKSKFTFECPYFTCEVEPFNSDFSKEWPAFAHENFFPDYSVIVSYCSAVLNGCVEERSLSCHFTKGIALSVDGSWNDDTRSWEFYADTDPLKPEYDLGYYLNLLAQCYTEFIIIY